jgi:hypothetical protein
MLLAALLAAPATAAPPENADPALAPWFQSLKAPDTGVGCCGEADCRAEPWRLIEDRYEAYLDNRWVPIPEDKILQRTDNPLGHAITCHAGQRIFCFIRPADT